MFQIDNSTSVAVKPTPEAAGTPGFFTNGDPVGGVPATIVEADWLNMVQSELIAILTAAGVTPSKTTANQILNALPAALATLPELGRSFGVNGYIKLFGGIFQYGNVATNASGIATVTFPIAFPTECLTALTTDLENIASAVAYGGAGLISATGMTLAYARGGAAVNAGNVFWLAFGR